MRSDLGKSQTMLHNHVLISHHNLLSLMLWHAVYSGPVKKFVFSLPLPELHLS
jgi:hypothetical protein